MSGKKHCLNLGIWKHLKADSVEKLRTLQQRGSDWK